MKYLLLIGLIVLLSDNIAGKVPCLKKVSPLIGFSSAWSDSRYDAANSAAGADYMTETEKEVIHILNLVRMDPALFEKTVVKNFPSYKGDLNLKNSRYFKSLSETLKNTLPLSILQPDRSLYEAAKCHAEASGRSGYTGHERTATCKGRASYMGECISYGYNNALDIVMALLIDEGVPSLGHRINFLTNFRSIGVSVKPHKTYRYNAVIDLGS